MSEERTRREGGDKDRIRTDFRLTPRDCLDPRNAPLWLILGLLRLAVQLPFRWQMALGAGLGRLLYHGVPSRRTIARTNIRIAFPDLDRDACEHMVREHFAGLGMSLLETGITWWRDPAWYLPRVQIEGSEHLEAALSQGRGALLLTPHYTALDLAGIAAARKLQLCATYDAPEHPLIEKLLIGHRKRLIDIVLHNTDIRGMLRTLRANRALFFAPDQTLRRSRGAVIAPFFGIPVVTSTGTSRLARMSKAPVVTMLLLRDPQRDGYTVRFLPALEDFPGDDIEADTVRVNEHMAAAIRQHRPEQYFWIHQRFKRGRSKHERIPYATPLQPPPLTYRLANWVAALPFAVHRHLRAARDGGAVYRRQREGRGLVALPKGAIWIHAASVGEVAAVIPLLHRLAAERDEPLLLSTNTPTGHAVAAARVPAGTALCYLPVDRPRAVRRFVRQLEPRLALIVETELWPWLYAHLEHAAVPIVLINGRLSERTRNAPRWLRPALTDCLKRCRLVLARSEDDATAFRKLGSSRKRTRTVGNLKYAAIDPNLCPIDPGGAFVLAASTHHDEEIRLATAWQAARRHDHLLVIAPRHPERGDDIERALGAAGLQVARRGRGDTVTTDTDVYLADTMGELAAFMAGAEVVIMGGSFVPHGGQNLLEPARLGRATIVGPHMDNFRDETERLLAAEGILQVADPAAAVAACNELLVDAGRRNALGERARSGARADTDIVRAYLDAVEEVLPADEARSRADS